MNLSFGYGHFTHYFHITSNTVGLRQSKPKKRVFVVCNRKKSDADPLVIASHVLDITSPYF